MSAPGRLRLVVVGQGYVGLPLAMRAVEVGHDVVGLRRRARRGSSGSRPGSRTSRTSRTSGSRSARHRPLPPRATARCCAGFDVAIITVPTPLREGIPDLSYIESSAQPLARYLRPGATVVLESTTYPGTTEELVAPLLEEGSGLAAGSDFHLGYSPERIDPGNTTWNFVTRRRSSRASTRRR